MILCYNVIMKKIFVIFVALLFTQTACDLQPKISSLPDSVGDFISARYPTLLADPNTSPEIYNSAAADYGVYASPELYGRYENNDYVMYASVDDYVVPPQASEYVAAADADMGGAIAETGAETVDDILVVPTYKDIGVRAGAEKSADEGTVLEVNKPKAGVKTVTRVELSEVRVVPGDTLYSLSRKYSVPVNDLAVMNNLKAPFNLVAGQKIRVPNLTDARAVENVVVKKKESSKTSQISSVDKTKAPEKKIEKTEKRKVADKAPVTTKNKTTAVAQTKKISSDPTKKLPKIAARSSSKFSWPVRGRILSDYGAKSNGLFNDGINISASRGSNVLAAENGVVAYAGNEVKGMGNLVIIQHDGGWMTVYAHMDSMVVRRGARVKVGQKIGTVGKTGKVETPQLHFEIRKGTRAYNPTSYLKK